MTDEGTPKPGRIEIGDEASSLIEMLRSRVAGKLCAKLPSSVPIACRIDGQRMPYLFRDGQLDHQQKVYLYFENLNEIRIATIAELEAYLILKEAWEDYDITVFGSSFDWFVGVTNNDTILVFGADKLLRYVARSLTASGSSERLRWLAP